MLQLVVVGDGPDRALLERRAREIAPGRVHFVGQQPDPARLLGAADVVLCTSTTEGLPAVLIEAGLCAVPAVATNVGFVRDVVVDGETGQLAWSGDVESVHSALLRALQDGAALGAAARARCLTRFELGVVASGWDHVLREVANEGLGER